MSNETPDQRPAFFTTRLNQQPVRRMMETNTPIRVDLKNAKKDHSVEMLAASMIQAIEEGDKTLVSKMLETYPDFKRVLVSGYKNNAEEMTLRTIAEGLGNTAIAHLFPSVSVHRPRTTDDAALQPSR